MFSGESKTESITSTTEEAGLGTPATFETASSGEATAALFEDFLK